MSEMRIDDKAIFLEPSDSFRAVLLWRGIVLQGLVVVSQLGRCQLGPRGLSVSPMTQDGRALLVAKSKVHTAKNMPCTNDPLRENRSNRRDQMG